MDNQSNIGSADLARILAKARDAAAGGIGALSTGEALAAALVLNRPDWLATDGRHTRHLSVAERIPGRPATS